TDLQGRRCGTNSVTNPKLPHTPRKAQKRSALSFELAGTTDPTAVTNVRPSTMSQHSPKRRVNHPKPPPRIKPEAPVCETTPAGNTSPYFGVATSTEPSRQPPAKRARRASQSTVTWRILESSMTKPSAQLPKPAKLCPPQRTAVTTPIVEAALTAD